MHMLKSIDQRKLVKLVPPDVRF